MENTPQTRRTFLATVALLIGGAGLLWRYLTPRAVARRRTILRVAKRDVPVHGALVYREARVALIRDNDAVIALSLVCTHLGCTVNVTEERLTCPCHGSVFARNGKVLSGPAPKPLARHAVAEREGMIEVAEATEGGTGKTYTDLR